MSCVLEFSGGGEMIVFVLHVGRQQQQQQGFNYIGMGAHSCQC